MTNAVGWLYFLVSIAMVHAKSILHISDIHLNVSLQEIEYGYDTSPMLLESALKYAKSVLANPDFFLYTGDHVAHGNYTDEKLAQSLKQNVMALQEFFQGNKNATAILGNADCSTFF